MRRVGWDDRQEDAVAANEFQSAECSLLLLEPPRKRLPKSHVAHSSSSSPIEFFFLASSMLFK